MRLPSATPREMQGSNCNRKVNCKVRPFGEFCVHQRKSRKRSSRSSWSCTCCPQACTTQDTPTRSTATARQEHKRAGLHSRRARYIAGDRDYQRCPAETITALGTLTPWRVLGSLWSGKAFRQGVPMESIASWAPTRRCAEERRMHECT